MAANRFATLIHRKTNRITLVLVYAFLEWTLIFFILLNSLFSYFILRFADYFGLKRPCLLCSRLDRFFDPSGKSPSHKDLLCDDHAFEISTAPSKPPLESKGSDESFDVFPKELVEPDLRDDKGYSNFIKTNLIGDDVQVHNGRLFTERSRSIFVLEEHIGSLPLIDSQKRREEQETEEKKDVDDKETEETEETEEKVINDEEEEEETEEKIVDDEDDYEFSCFVSSFDCNKEVVVTEKEEEEEGENRVDLVDVTDDKTAPATNLEFYIDDQDCHLIPVEEFYKPTEEVREISDVNGDFILDFGAEPDFSAAGAPAEEEDARLSSPGDSKHEEVAETNQGDSSMFVCADQQQPDFAATEAEAAAAGEVEDVGLSSDEVSTFPTPGESEPENSKKTQGDCPDQQQSVPDLKTTEEDVRLLSSDEISTVPLSGESKQDEAETKQDSPTDDELLQTQTDEEETDADVSIGTEIPDHEQLGDDQSSHELIPEDNNDEDYNDHTLEFRTVDIETRRPVLNANKERLLLETSRSIMFQLDRTTEPEPEHTLERSSSLTTVEKLKSELEEERKALNALYEELEEERSASATAANETMAMINRLHEEKAAMQMEALQYQRMMEEQSEFDQEALQLLNEVIVKREKEIAELEKELEVCRKRLEEYEAKERMGMMMRRMRDSSVDSYRNNGDSDENNNGELQQHKNVEGENEMENTPVDVVLRLDECLDDYEGERLSILGRLKFLEEKLTALNDEEEEEAKTFESNGVSINGNGHLTNGKHRVLKSKRLLPLFDAVDGEIGNGEHYENGVDESEKGDIVNVEDEVDELYERLEALEADREFLRHCVGSLKKGDKGVHLLHEILQHLRDLKNIDLIRVRENEDMSY
ncbi:Myosin-binding protein 2 [Hirschfeldia incana]|nr:Myosin-binding protein 2 [Hirschfeldia incana]KAJ0241185.1 Myosin-binding protein 2 [Hirschfeldia incana]